MLKNMMVMESATVYRTHVVVMVTTVVYDGDALVMYGDIMLTAATMMTGIPLRFVPPWK